mmetsp:Transcript_1146/g.3240  ORF Transcript_1146/g.3240 Transcript_1146/m.3240 type:complete len:126 (+) Transcript_1146:254-631(+)
MKMKSNPPSYNESSLIGKGLLGLPGQRRRWKLSKRSPRKISTRRRQPKQLRSEPKTGFTSGLREPPERTGRGKRSEPNRREGPWSELTAPFLSRKPKLDARGPSTLLARELVKDFEERIHDKLND